MKSRIREAFHITAFISTLNHIALFAFDLGCAWFASRLLELALKSMWYDIGVTAVVGIVCISISCCVLGILSYKNKKASQDSIQSYRQMICRSVIHREININTSGELDARLQADTDTIAIYYNTAFPKAIAACLTLLICLTIIWQYDSHLALIFGVLGLLQLLPTILYEKWAKAIYQQTRVDEEAYCEWVGEGLQGISTIKAYQQESWFVKRFREYQRAIVESGKKENRTAAVEDVVTQFISVVLAYGSYAILGVFVLLERIDISHVPLLIVLAQRSFTSIEALVDSRMAQFRYQEAVMRLENNAINKQSIVIPKCPQPDIVAQASNVSKTYDGKVLLSNVSLCVKQNERVLLMGANGSGKTTLMRILLGLCEPDTGYAWHDATTSAFSLQEEPQLNIPICKIVDTLVRDGDITYTDFLKHVHAFNIADILTQKPAECSTGQRKKLYLAIALARNAEFLVLDEPTNHLDVDSIKYLLEKLAAHHGSLLVCTHDVRLSLNWNKIYRMKEGTLYEA